MREYGNLIGGRWVQSGRKEDVFNPYDGKPVGTVCLADTVLTEQAIESALAGYQQTKRLPAFEREAILRRIASRIAQRRDECAQTMTQESGKPLKYALTEVDRAITTFLLAAEESKRIYGEVIPFDIHEKGTGRFACTQRFPKGVILGISPFNFPLNLAAHKVAPALASGNSIILKPSPKTPITALLLGEVIREAGAPAGAVTIICCSNELTAELVRDERIAMVSFTGSAAVGWQIKQMSGKKKVVLELGGNAAAILHQDGDIEYAVTRCIIGGFAYSGQVCISLQRIYVDQNIYDDFCARFIDAAGKLVIGDPLDTAIDIGPLINDAAAERIEVWLEEAVSQGAQVLRGGKRTGRLFEPTVLTAVKPGMKVWSEEVFGPVVTVIPYTSFDEAIEAVNNSRYGLQAGVFTKDVNLLFKAFREINVGAVIANDVPTYRLDHMPYGGVKDSGMGREGIRSSIEEMTDEKLLIINFPN